MTDPSDKKKSAILRLMEARDLPEVMKIENASFQAPWSQRFFLDELRLDASRAWVAVIEGEGREEVVGYVCSRFVLQEASILNIAVAPEWRHLGLGRTLLRKVIAEARRYSYRNVNLEVRRSNETAQRLYHSEGFGLNGVRKKYYTDNGEDAFVMVLDLQPSSP